MSTWAAGVPPSPGFRLRKTWVTFVVFFFGGLFVITLAPFVAPERYFRDSSLVTAMIESGVEQWRGSFEGTAMLYSRLTAGNVLPRPVIGSFNFMCALTVLLLVHRSAGGGWSVRVFFHLSVWVALLALFVGMYSKETFTFMLTASVLLLVARTNVGRFVLVATLFALYGAFVREYWLLIFAYFVAFAVAFSVPLSLRARLTLAVVVVAAASIGFWTVTGTYLTDTRVLMNLGREGSPDVRTMTFNLLANNSPVHDVANQLVAWGGFMFPVRLVAMGAPQHVAFAAWQLTSVGVVVASVRRIRRAVATMPSKAARVARRRVRLLVAFLLAFTFAHAAFEGDFGSYARHQIALLPLILYLMTWAARLRRDESRASR